MQKAGMRGLPARRDRRCPYRACRRAGNPPGPPLSRSRSPGASTRWHCPPRPCSAHRERPLTVPCPRPGRPAAAACTLAWIKNAWIPAGQGQKPQHMPLRRGQHHISAGTPGQPLHPQQGAKRSAIDEVKRRPVDDQAATGYHQGRDRRPSFRRADNVQVPAQGHDNMTVTGAGTQLYTRHGSALCYTSRAGSGPNGSISREPHSYPAPADTNRPRPDARWRSYARLAECSL